MEPMATQPVCPKCGGSGWIIVERASVSGAEPCECRLEGRAERLESRAQIPVNYRDATFDNFNVPGPENPIERRELTNVLLAVKGYLRNFPDEKRPGLLLIGETGTGKTHLAVAALKHIMAKGFECLFWNYQNLLDSIRAGYDPVSNSADREAYRSVLEVQVLLLDDLGAHRVTEWVEDTVTSIITYRCDHRKPVIATTNAPDADAGSIIERRHTLAEQIGARARSRLFEMCTVVRMPLIEDYRLRKAKRL